MLTNKEFIEMGMFDSTLNKAQFKILGQCETPSAGWEALVIDKEISQKEANLFLLLKGMLTSEAQEQILQNYQLILDFKTKKVAKTTIASDSIQIYCDGACLNNPGNAGSGLSIYNGNDKPILLHGQYADLGTNNTAELNALHKALLIAQESQSPDITIFSDSKYSIDCITKWAYGWKSKSWTKKGGEIKNLEIIKIAHTLYDKIKDEITIKHVKAHAGIEGNELADRMAMIAISSKNDEYEEYIYHDTDEVLQLSRG